MSLKEDFARNKKDGVWPGTERGMAILMSLFAIIALSIGMFVSFSFEDLAIQGRILAGLILTGMIFAALMMCVCSQNPD